jgi:hypothetical protein
MKTWESTKGLDGWKGAAFDGFSYDLLESFALSATGFVKFTHDGQKRQLQTFVNSRNSTTNWWTMATA